MIDKSSEYHEFVSIFLTWRKHLNDIDSCTVPSALKFKQVRLWISLSLFQEADDTGKLKTFEDFMSLSMPIDDEEVNKTVKELHRMSIIPNPDTNVSHLV